MEKTKHVFERPGGKAFVCHNECITVDELVEIGKEIGVIKND